MRPIQIAKALLSCIALFSGGVSLFNVIRRSWSGGGNLTILAYHNVSSRFPRFLDLAISPDLFERQVKFIVKYFDVVSLDRATELFLAHERPKRDSVAFTFDDNYFEYFDTLMPIVEKYSLPVTVFVSTAPLNSRRPLFVDGLIHALCVTKKQKVVLVDHGLGTIYINNSADKIKAIKTINEYSKQLSPADTVELFSNILQQLGVADDDMNGLTLSWDNIKSMSRNGIMFGAHTVNHPQLANIPIELTCREVVESKITLEKYIGCEIRCFAYPYGTDDSYNTKVMKAVSKAGFDAAYTLDWKNEHVERTPFNIPRRNMTTGSACVVGESFFLPLFAVEMSGLGDYLFLRKKPANLFPKKRSH